MESGTSGWGASDQPGCPPPTPRWGQVDSADIELSGKGPGLLVEEEGLLSVQQKVVVDDGQARVDLHLGLLVAQVHSCCQRQLVVPGCIEGVLKERRRLATLHTNAQLGAGGGVRVCTPPPRLAHPRPSPGTTLKPRPYPSLQPLAWLPEQRTSPMLAALAPHCPAQRGFRKKSKQL